MDHEQKFPTPLQSYHNSIEGFKRLWPDMLATACLVGKKVPIVISFEPTSNFRHNLGFSLRKRKAKRFTIRVLNPYAVKQFRKMNFVVSKLAAKLIAKYLFVTPQTNSSFECPEHMFQLKELVRFRRRLVEERTTQSNKLHKVLRLVYPGYKRVLGKKFTHKVLSILSDCPKSKIKGLEELCQNKRLAMTVENEISFTVKRIIQIKEISIVFNTHYRENILFSIPRLGNVTIATILSKIGDSANRFKNVREFIGYIGLYPVVYGSSQNKARFKMTWKGNKWLKMALLVAAASSRRFNPALRNFYNRLRAKGKGKLACLVYAVFKSQRPWDRKKALESIIKGSEMANRAKELGVEQINESSSFTKGLDEAGRLTRIDSQAI
jgi:transposase